MSRVHSISISDPCGAMLVCRRLSAITTMPGYMPCWWQGTTEPYPSRDMGSLTSQGMALPVHGTSMYCMMWTAPYSVLSLPSAWQGSSMYHFKGGWYHFALGMNPWPITHKASTPPISHRCGEIMFWKNVTFLLELSYRISTCQLVY